MANPVKKKLEALEEVNESQRKLYFIKHRHEVSYDFLEVPVSYKMLTKCLCIVDIDRCK